LEVHNDHYANDSSEPKPSTTNVDRATTPTEIVVFIASWHQSNVVLPPSENGYFSPVVVVLACCYCTWRYF